MVHSHNKISKRAYTYYVPKELSCKQFSSSFSSLRINIKMNLHWLSIINFNPFRRAKFLQLTRDSWLSINITKRGWEQWQANNIATNASSFMCLAMLVMTSGHGDSHAWSCILCWSQQFQVTWCVEWCMSIQPELLYTFSNTLYVYCSHVTCLKRDYILLTDFNAWLYKTISLVCIPGAQEEKSKERTRRGHVLYENDLQS